jgi:hypothetical protein
MAASYWTCWASAWSISRSDPYRVVAVRAVMYRVSTMEPAGIRHPRVLGAVRRALELWRRVVSVEALQRCCFGPPAVPSSGAVGVAADYVSIPSWVFSLSRPKNTTST